MGAILGGDGWDRIGHGGWTLNVYKSVHFTFPFACVYGISAGRDCYED